MEIKDLIDEVRAGFMEAELDQLEIWNARLVTAYAFMAENIGAAKRDRAQAELDIKNRLIEANLKVTEKSIERHYKATSQGQFLAYNEATIKGVSRLISAVRFKIEALRGIIR